MVAQYRLRLLLAVTFISSAAAQSNLPSQRTSAAAPSATSSRSYPQCAEICLAAATSSLPCSEADSSCLCAHQDDVRDSVESCLIESSACPAADASAAAKYYPNVCKALGLDENGEPVIAVPSSTIATAANVDGLVPVSTETLLSADSTSAPTTATTSTEQGDDKEAEDGAGGLSVPTVAGIAAGCAFIVVALMSGLIWMYIKRRDSDEEIRREIESQSKKPEPGFENSTSSKILARKSSEKTTDYALSPLPSRMPPEYSRSTKPTLADRRNHSAKPLQRSPSETLNNSSYPFPFGDKTAAEASMTSLALPNSASKPVSAIIIQKSPARSQFSDQASICSVSSIHSEVAQIHHISDTRQERPNTFFNLYSGELQGQSSTSLVPPSETSVRGSSHRSLRRSQFGLEATAIPPAGSSANERHSMNPFTTSLDTEIKQDPFSTPAKEIPNPFDAASPEQSVPVRQSLDEPASRRSLVKSANSFGKFDFEIADEARKSSGRRSSMLLRDSFFNSLDLGLKLFDTNSKK